MRNGGGAGLITVRQVPATAARESNFETAPILDQRHPRRLLRSRGDDPGRGVTSLLFAGLSERLELKLVGRQELRSGAVALRYQPSRVTA